MSAANSSTSSSTLATIIGAAINARDDVLRASDLDITYLKPNTLSTNALWWKNKHRHPREGLRPHRRRPDTAD